MRVPTVGTDDEFVSGLVDLLEAPAQASPEARMAAAAWEGAVLPADLLNCAGGIELADVGFVADVRIAAQHDVSEVVPVLVGESFRDAASLRPPGPRLRRIVT